MKQGKFSLDIKEVLPVLKTFKVVNMNSVQINKDKTKKFRVYNCPFDGTCNFSCVIDWVLSLAFNEKKCDYKIHKIPNNWSHSAEIMTFTVWYLGESQGYKITEVVK